MSSRSSCLLLSLICLATNMAQAAEEFDEFFEMELSELLQVTVTAPGKIAQTQTQSPSVVEIITREDIQAFGANSLLEVLDRATSINMLGSFFYPQNLAVIRGVQLTHSNNDVLILINGRPLRDSFTGGQNFALFTGFPLESVKQIEIIRGPGSPLYGTNAFVGVINITTDTDKMEPEFTATLGSYNSQRLTYQSGFNSGDWRTNLGMRLFKEDGWRFNAIDNSGNTGHFDTGENNHSLFVYSQSDLWKVNALYVKSEQDFWGSVSSWSGPEQDTRVVKSTKALLDIGRTFRLSEQQRWEANLGYTSSHFSHYNYDAKSENWLGELTHHYTLDDKSHWLTGFTGWHQDVKTLDGLRDAPIPAFSRNWWTVYSQYQSISNEFVNWTVGVQVNKIPKVSANFVPRGSINIRLNDNSGLKINYGEAFRAAYSVETSFNLIVCCDAQGNNRGGLRGNPALEPEEIATEEIQYSYQSDSTQLNITAFRSKLTNLIERERAADRVLDFVNRGELDVLGGELEGKYQLRDATRITFSYTYQENESDGVSNYTLMPNHMFKFGINHNFDEQIKLGIFNSYFSKFHDNSKRKSSTSQMNPEADAYNMMSAELRYKFKIGGREAQLSLYGYNLLDEAIFQPEIAGRNINTHPLRSGRAWYLTYRMSF